MAATTGTVSHPHGNDVIEVDDTELIGDEAYGSEQESTFTASVTSSILAYRNENGRTYHSYKDGSYLFPNDDVENDRLDMQHAVFLRSMDGKLCFAPMPKDPQNVLDIGTGTGIWAIDFADEYPSAQVIGTDLSPIQPSMVPPNLTFLVDDAEAEWQFRQKFDLIHGRMMAASFRDWDRFYRQCYDNVKPGGYVEMQDIQFTAECDDDSMPESSPLRSWVRHLIKALSALERPAEVAKEHKQRMEKAGFVDVTQIILKWPMNSWPKDPKMKEIGTWTMVNALQGLQALTMAPLTRGAGWKPEAVEAFLVDVRKEIMNRRVHAYWPIYVVYGRKPAG